MTPKTTWPFIKYFLKPHKIYVIIFIILMVITGLHGTIHAYLTKIIIDVLGSTESKNVLQAILWPAILFIISYEVNNLAWRGAHFINYKIQPIIKTNIIGKTFDSVNRHSYQFFHNQLAGNISNNINLLADTIEKILHVRLMGIIKQFVYILAALVAMYSVHHYFFIGLMVWVMSFILVSLYFSHKFKALANLYAASQSSVSGIIVDAMVHSQIISIFANKDFESNYLRRFLLFMRQAFQKKEFYAVKFYFLKGFSITFLISFMVFLLIHLRSKNLITIGDFSLILSLTIYTADQSWWLTEQIDYLNDDIGRCNQSLAVLFSPIEIEDAIDAQNLIVTQGEITFENVYFSYKGVKPLFQNKSLTVKSGQKVGLVGYSGSGKTSFVNLILRLYDIDSGSISIDRQNIKIITQDSLHKNIGIIPQDSSLFHRSVMENIRYGRIDASDEEVMEAAKKAMAHKFILNLPDGYHSLVGERGIKLSGGQRQRIAIARAILKNAPILILDEATSALDSIIERKIQESLIELMHGKTTIVIAHRLSTLLHMDRILVFNNGEIIEDGSHDKLLKQAGLYKNLWEMQVDTISINNPANHKR